MINYETLLSNYDDRITLLEYLKKVEAALADASATSFSVTKTGNATLKFVLTFADGSTLESPEIVLQQGESVASAAISNNHLLLTLTNGDVLDAGELFNGNVNINGNLSTTGDLDIAGTSEFHDAAQFDSDVNIGGDVSTGALTPSNLLIPSTGSIKPASAGQTQIDADVGIVEKMSGYNFTNTEYPEITKELIYVGAVKNGNKLTFSVAVKVTRSADDTTQFMVLGDIQVPSAIYAALYPVRIGGTNTLDARKIVASSGIVTNIDINAYCYKEADRKLRFGIHNAQTLTAGTEYYIRYELTFLLSNSLAA